MEDAEKAQISSEMVSASLLTTGQMFLRSGLATVIVVGNSLMMNGRTSFFSYSEDLQNDYIALTDIAKKREGEYPGYVIQNWLRNKSTVSFVGLWESIHNPNFNCLEFDAIKREAGG